MNHFDWNAIRSDVDPYSYLSHSKQDVFLFMSRKVASSFGKRQTSEKKWLFSSEDCLFSFFQEIVLRQMLFDDFINGDAVSSLQSLDFSSVLSLLMEGAKKGEFDSFHGGYASLKEIYDWSRDKKIEGRYERLEKILLKYQLNLHVEYYPSFSEALEKGKESELLFKTTRSDIF